MAVRRVLVVDDEPDIRETIVEVLQDNGFEAEGVADGIEALARLRDPENRWGVVLLDLMMPDMDGATFREHQLGDPVLSEIPIVLVSARDDVKVHAERLRAAAYVTKPISLRLLLDTIQPFCKPPP